MNPFAISEDRLRELAAPYGGIDALNQQMALHNQATARLSKEWDDLMAQHPDHWVAMGPDGLLATAPTVQALLSELSAAGKENDPFAVDFLDTTSDRLILSPLG